jgi:hypothetical protein
MVDADGRRDWVSIVSSGGRAPDLKDLARRIIIVPDFLANVRAIITSGCRAERVTVRSLYVARQAQCYIASPTATTEAVSFLRQGDKSSAKGCPVIEATSIAATAHAFNAIGVAGQFWNSAGRSLEAYSQGRLAGP